MINKNLYLVALVLIAGCGQQQAESESSSMAEFSLETHLIPKSKDAVLVKVNGKSYTRGDFEAEQMMRAHLAELSISGKFEPLSDAAKTSTAMMEQKRISEFIRKTILNDEASSCGVTVTDDEINKGWCRVRSKFNRDGKDFQDVAKEFATVGLKDQFIDWLRTDAIFKAIYRVSAPSLVEVTEADVDRGENWLKDFNKVATLSNEVAVACLSNVVQLARGGADFQQLAKEWGQINVEEGEKWGDFLPSEPEVETFRDVLTASKVGDVLGPYELDVGFSVIKVLAIEEAESIEQGMVIPIMTKSYRLARITRNLYETLEMTREEIFDVIQKDRYQDAHKALMDRLFATAVIESPSGEHPFEEIKSNKNKNKNNIQLKTQESEQSK